MTATGDIRDLDTLRPYAGRIVKLSQDAGRTWTYARLVSDPCSFTDGSYGYSAAAEIGPGDVDRYDAITNLDFDQGLIVRPATVREWIGKRFSYHPRFSVRDVRLLLPSPERIGHALAEWYLHWPIVLLLGLGLTVLLVRPLEWRAGRRLDTLKWLAVAIVANLLVAAAGLISGHRRRARRTGCSSTSTTSSVGRTADPVDKGGDPTAGAP
jgi:hypothetical protein